MRYFQVKEVLFDEKTGMPASQYEKLLSWHPKEMK